MGPEVSSPPISQEHPPGVGQDGLGQLPSLELASRVTCWLQLALQILGWQFLLVPLFFNGSKKSHWFLLCSACFLLLGQEWRNPCSLHVRAETEKQIYYLLSLFIYHLWTWIFLNLEPPVVSLVYRAVKKIQFKLAFNSLLNMPNFFASPFILRAVPHPRTTSKFIVLVSRWNVTLDMSFFIKIPVCTRLPLHKWAHYCMH